MTSVPLPQNPAPHPSMANYPSMSWKDFLYRDPDGLGRMAWGGAAALALQIVSIGFYLDLIVRERAVGWTPGDPTPWALHNFSTVSADFLIASILAAIIGLILDTWRLWAALALVLAGILGTILGGFQGIS